ncbi:hypothetical protein [Butyrivibrio sp. NC3005]|uniref:hypothetical protein n=1 Tax=Butyrivibrio sp. NC3005 TaxID=1280685 RepID=UPI0012DEFEB1|nr:hypothetical protein [Butyrivibrio sp. NC3005]
MNIRHYCVFDKKMYIGESITHPRLVKLKLALGKPQLLIYVICKASNNVDQLEICHSLILKQKYYKHNPVYVYGIAKGYREALDIIVKISDEASECNMPGQLLGYLQSASSAVKTAREG